MLYETMVSIHKLSSTVIDVAEICVNSRRSCDGAHLVYLAAERRIKK